ncbi:MAG: 3-hydroxyacyl-ACP dehydratase FabZ [Neisseriaceae bacterium]|nr:MAG: 3-hydroxyacyl-ACP dehydratase FabZ [Neisseriaceae bacterium]
MKSVILPLEAKDIEKIIPHRSPFLLVDRVIELELSKSIKALKSISMNEPYFMGHFPGYPVMPGVLIIEALAQTAAVLATLSFETQEDELYFFASITNARFKRPVFPGDTLILEASILNQKSGVGKFSVKASVDYEVATEAEITCARKNIG